MGPSLVAVAHGTRDPAGVAVTEALVDQVRALRPGLDVRLCYLGLTGPGLQETLAGLGGRDTVVVPLLLGAGHHVRVDIPRAVADAPRHLRVRTASALGPHPLLVTALADRLTESGRQGGPVVLAAAGSSDARANGETRVIATHLSSRLGAPVVPAFLSAARPTPAEAAAGLRAAGHDDVMVAPYLLGPGFFAREAEAAAAGRASGPLGAHAALARLVALRYDEARAGSTPRQDAVTGPGRGRRLPMGL
ncbi:sirohydrochlorin chelatase [Streptomyces fuscigenes]|nr:sirohydrochlorin chelatase [Streptomyces fuscigenes]